MLLPIVALIVGLLAGALSGEFLATPVDAGETVEETASTVPATGEAGLPGAKSVGGPAEPDPEGGRFSAPDSKFSPPPEFAAGEGAIVPLNRRLIIPVISDRRTQALVLIDVALEVPAALAQETHRAMPLLRDAFFRALLDLSAGGAFKNGVADPVLIERIRVILRRQAASTLSTDQINLLILEALSRPV